LGAAEQNTFRAEFDVIGFDHNPFTAAENTFRAKFDVISFDHNLLAAAQNTFRIEFDTIGFDQVMNVSVHVTPRPKQVSPLNDPAVNVVEQVMTGCVQVTQRSDLNSLTPIQDTRQFQADPFRREQVVLGGDQIKHEPEHSST